VKLLFFINILGLYLVKIILPYINERDEIDLYYSGNIG